MINKSELSEKFNIACFNGNNDLVIKLLEKGAEINNLNEYNYSPVIASINGRQIETLILLIKKGADMNFGDWTPLHDIIDTSIDDFIQLNKEEIDETLIEMLKIIIKNGGNLNKKNSQGYRPLDIINYPCQSEVNFIFLKNKFKSHIENIDIYCKYKPK